MDTKQPFYRKAVDQPIYYRVDEEKQLIESIKNWSDRPKSIERFIYQSSFASDIKQGYQEIPARYYHSIRNYILQQLTAYMTAGLGSPTTEPTESEIGEGPENENSPFP